MVRVQLSSQSAVGISHKTNKMYAYGRSQRGGWGNRRSNVSIGRVTNFNASAPLVHCSVKPSIWPDSTIVTESRATIAGCDLRSLAQQYGTPLYIYDEETLRANAGIVRSTFARMGARISFAAKACSLIGVLRIFQQERLDVDVVSTGEIEAATRAGFRPGQMHLHGNFKSDMDLQRAVELGIRAVVLDNHEEMERLSAICEHMHRPMQVMLRITLPMEANTHPHIQTSGLHSKFGIPHESEYERSMLHKLRNHGFLHLTGLHTHLGSQIQDAEIYGRAARALCRLASDLIGSGMPIEEVSVGGGWGVPYLEEEGALVPESVASVLATVFDHFPSLRPAVEPGRALVARAPVALYSVGSVKTSPSGRVVAVDGGMGDNLRAALYGARYSAFAVEHMSESHIGTADVVGRYCEAGDFLVRSVPLPHLVQGDLIAVTVAGAYQISMASAYNSIPPPAVIIVAEGKSRLLARRQTAQELLARELPEA